MTDATINSCETCGAALSQVEVDACASHSANLFCAEHLAADIRAGELESEAEELRALAERLSRFVQRVHDDHREGSRRPTHDTDSCGYCAAVAELDQRQSTLRDAWRDHPYTQELRRTRGACLRCGCMLMPARLAACREQNMVQVCRSCGQFAAQMAHYARPVEARA